MSIFNNDNYKLILKSVVDQKRGQQKGLLSRMAQYLRVNPSFVSQVLSGPKDFSEEQIILVCEFLGIGKLESRYLLTLVQIARAGSVKLKEIHQENLLRIRKQAKELANLVPEHRQMTSLDEAQFYSSWIYAMVQLFVSMSELTSFQAICDKFDLERQDAQKIISFLLETGLIQEAKGAYKSGSVNTHLRKDSPFAINHLRNWRLRAIDKVDKFKADELMYSCSFTISTQDFAKLREQFLQVIQDFLKVAQASPAENLALFNIDLLKF